MVRACEVQRQERNNPSSIKKDEDNANGTGTRRKKEKNSTKSVCVEMERIEERMSIAPHKTQIEPARSDQTREGNGMNSRKVLVAQGGSNRMRRPLDLFLQQTSLNSSPASGGLSLHSPQ